MSKLKKFDVFLFILFLAIGIGAGYFSYEMYHSPKSNQAERVGYLAFAPGDVFRKGSEDFFYAQENVNAIIHNYDQITTGMESKAKIVLDQGSSLELDQLSHILISVKDGQYALDIRAGATHATLNNGQTFLVDGTRVIAPYNGSAVVLYDKLDKDAEITVLKGQIKVSNGADEKILSADNGLTKLGRAGDVLQPIQLNLPHEAELIISPTKEVELSWEPFTETTNYSVELIQNDKIIQSFETLQTHLKVTVPNEGEFQWKVSGIEKRKVAQSEIRKFQVNVDPGFELISPKDKEIFSFKEPATDLSLNFQFKAKIKSPWLFIEELDKKEITKSQVNQTDQTPAPGLAATLGAARFRWGLSQTEAELPTQWNQFEIKKISVPKKLPKKIPVTTTLPPPPTLPPTTLPPPTTTTLAMKVSKNGIEIPSIVSPKADDKVKAKGEITKVAVKVASQTCKLYEVEADTDARFTLPIITRSVKPTASLSLKKGSYYIHARCWKSGDMGSWSAPTRFVIE